MRNSGICSISTHAENVKVLLTSVSFFRHVRLSLLFGVVILLLYSSFGRGQMVAESHEPVLLHQQGSDQISIYRRFLNTIKQAPVLLQSYSMEWASMAPGILRYLAESALLPSLSTPENNLASDSPAHPSFVNVDTLSAVDAQTDWNSLYHMSLKEDIILLLKLGQRLVITDDIDPQAYVAKQRLVSPHILRQINHLIRQHSDRENREQGNMGHSNAPRYSVTSFIPPDFYTENRPWERPPESGFPPLEQDIQQAGAHSVVTKEIIDEFVICAQSDIIINWLMEIYDHFKTDSERIQLLQGQQSVTGLTALETASNAKAANVLLYINSRMEGLGIPTNINPDLLEEREEGSLSSDSRTINS
ncbi:hypothetical protein ACH42_14885 [Endozoicomonas sp. (ex Bugula neritina AB1)]|nr:hypothetical protein ACH42_14885 [Endozoicomonas sp. (ex Bugula neritina AB1)]